MNIFLIKCRQLLINISTRRFAGFLCALLVSLSLSFLTPENVFKKKFRDTLSRATTAVENRYVLLGSTHMNTSYMLLYHTHSRYLYFFYTRQER